METDSYTQLAGLDESCSLEEQDLAGGVARTSVPVDISIPRPLWNKSEPMYVNQHEKYEHRIVAHLKALGNSNVDIARIVGKSPVTINYLVKQPYMESLILEEIQKTGDAAMAVLQAEALEAAKRLIVIAKESENDETRRKANNDILDRKYGKANQPMTVRQVDASEVTDSELLNLLKQN